MNAAPPHVADDDPPTSLVLLAREMAPRPGRVTESLRIVVCALIVVVSIETFQVSNPALDVYFTFILFRPDANVAARLTIVAAVAVLAGILVPIVFFMATLSDAALRIPLMALVTFAAMFCARASLLGPTAMVAGLFMINSLANGDNLNQQGTSPYYATNTGKGAPEALFISPEESLVLNLLYEALGITVAVATVVIVSKLTAKDPETSYRTALADRLAAAKAFCAGEPGARAPLVDFARAGTATLAAQGALVGKVKGMKHVVAGGAAAIAETSRLLLILLAFAKLPPGERDEAALAQYARPLAEFEVAVRHGRVLNETPAPPGVPRASSSTGAAPLLTQVEDCVGALRAALSAPSPPASAAKGGLLKPDAFSDPGYTQFALKATLAFMACYIFMNLVDWPQINTCLTTCFVVSLETVGQSVQKMAARLTGAAIGAAIGFIAILYVMPLVDDIGQLIVLLLPVLFLCAWVRTGSERIQYVGQQMSFAFLLMVLQRYGPTLDYDTGRDRVVGILVGEVAITTVFTQIWPVRVADAVRRRIADALTTLGDVLGARDLDRAHGAAAAQAFGETIGAARGMLVNDPYEPEDLLREAGSGRIDGVVLTALQAASIPLEIVADGAPVAERGDERLAAHRRALAGWLGDAAAWVRDGRGAGELARTLPAPPNLDDADRNVAAASRWYTILDRDLRDVLQKADADALAS